MKSKILYGLLVCCFYLFLFQPPLISKYIYISVELLLYILFCIKNNSYFKSFLRDFKREFIAFFLIISLSTSIDFLTGSLVYADRFAAFFFQSFIFSHFIYVLSTKHHIPLIKIIASTCLLAAVISVLFVFNPTLDLIYKAISTEFVYEQYSSFDERYRGYGASENLLFTYSYVMGFCAGMTLLIYKRLYYIFYFGLFFLAVVYNARIGFLPLALFIIYMIIALKTKSIIKILLTLVILLAIQSYYSLDIVDSLIKNQAWSLDIMSNMADEGTLGTLANEMIVLPEDIKTWLVGSGISLFNGYNGKYSDIGYILQLYYGGLLLMFLLFYFMYTCFNRVLKYYKRDFFAIVFIVSVMLLNVKGFLFAATPGARFLFFIYVVYMLNINSKYSIANQI